MSLIRDFFIEDILINPNNKAFIIAEVAQAHDGSLGLAHSFIDIAADFGADAVKFQTHLSDEESTLDEEFRIPFSYKDKTRFEYWQRMEFSFDEWVGLYEHAKQKNIIFLSSAFSLTAIELLEKINMPAWKVASGEVNNFSLLKKLSHTKKPILLSTGMSSFDDITNAIKFIEAEGVQDIALFQCTTEYPTSLEKVGINVMKDLENKFSRPVGLSDHSGEIAPSIYAIANGASIIEVHIALHPYQFGPDTIASLKPEDLKVLADFRDKFHIMKNNPVDKDKAALGLKKMSSLFGKSLSLKSDQKKGTVLKENMITFKKPGNGLKQNDIKNLLGKKLKRDVNRNRLLRIEDIDFN